jgi:hypothetical protein
MQSWHDAGLLAFTLNLQGGSPLGYGNQGWINSTFDEKGDLRAPYINRLKKILDRADSLSMVVILGYFYFGQDEYLLDETAVIHAVETITNWILDAGYENILVEINNESNVRYDHDILRPDRVHELIEKVQGMRRGDRRLLASTSYGGGFLPLSNVVRVSDYILLHDNGMSEPSTLIELVENTRKVDGYSPKPILFNEDDHYNFESDTSNFVAAVQAYASWGYFDYRMEGEGFNFGYQSVPVDWRINSPRKISFFNKVREISGY